MDWQSILLASGYFFLFIAGSFALAFYWKRKRRTEIPFDKKLRLARQPGESQLELVRKGDEDDLFWIMLGGAAPAISLGVMLKGTAWFFGSMKIAWFVLSLAVFAVVLWFAMRMMAKRLQERSDRYLGAFGERFVGELLDPLKREKWHVFHDMPAEGKRRDFNLDHVVVGPTGVYVIETKTWRKEIGKGLPGATVIYDGRTLRGPRGVNNKPLDQVEANAKWLQEFLKAKLEVEVRPVLTFPEWGVKFDLSAPDNRDTRVVISSSLVKFLTTGQRPLSEQQVDRIAEVIKERCRTVEY